MPITKKPIGVKVAIWTGIFAVTVAIINGIFSHVNAGSTDVASIKPSIDSNININNSKNTVIGNGNTINQSISESGPYDTKNGDNLLERYHNERFNTTIYYPTSWKMDRLPTNGDGFKVIDPNGSATVTFYGRFAFKPDMSNTYTADEWDDYFEALNVDDGDKLIQKRETAFFIKSKGSKNPIPAAELIYYSSDKFSIRKSTIIGDRELTIIVCCSILESDKYKAIFQKIVNDIFVEDDGVM